MAITGTGTELDPFIVHSYDEIQQTVGSSTTGTTYTKLANDIDCNDYGADWEWESVLAPSNSERFFDLDGHTIKNLYIKNDNYAFKGYNSSYRIHIYNGKILNVFGSAPKAFMVSGDFANLSISLQFTTITEAQLFNTVKMRSCALYIILLNGTGRTLFGTGNVDIQNLDLYLEVYNINSTTSSSAFRTMGQSSGTYTFDSIRLHGKAHMGESCTYANTMIAAGKMTNSVVDFDMTEFDEMSGGSSSYNAIGGTSNNTTVINSALLPSNVVVPTGYLSAPSSQAMRTGADLRSLGFLVVNVEGS